MFANYCSVPLTGISSTVLCTATNEIFSPGKSKTTVGIEHTTKCAGARSVITDRARARMKMKTEC